MDIWKNFKFPEDLEEELARLIDKWESEEINMYDMKDYTEFGKAEQILRTVYDYCTTYVRTNMEMEKKDREAREDEKWSFYHRGANKLAFEIMRQLEVIYPDVFVKVYGAKKDD